MDGECLSVTVVDRVAKLDTLGGYVFLAFLLCLLVGFILGLLLARYILRELEVRYTILVILLPRILAGVSVLKTICFILCHFLCISIALMQDQMNHCVFCSTVNRNYMSYTCIFTVPLSLCILCLGSAASSFSGFS